MSSPSCRGRLVPSPSGWPADECSQRNLGRPLADWMAQDAATLAAWLPASWIPFALAWIEYESNGNLRSTGGYTSGGQTVREYGLWQFSSEEAASLGVSDADYDRLRTDRTWSLQAGANYLGAVVQKLVDDGIPHDAESTLPLAKLVHTIGHGGTRRLLRDAGGANVARWEDLRDSWKRRASNDNKLGGHSLAGVDTADAVWWRSAQIAAALGLPADHGHTEPAPLVVHARRRWVAPTVAATLLLIPIGLLARRS